MNKYASNVNSCGITRARHWVLIQGQVSRKRRPWKQTAKFDIYGFLAGLWSAHASCVSLPQNRFLDEIQIVAVAAQTPPTPNTHTIMDHPNPPLSSQPKLASESTLHRATPTSNRFRSSQLLRFGCYLLTSNVFPIRFCVNTSTEKNWIG